MKNFNEIKDKVRKANNNALTKTFKSGLAKILAKQIRQRTRLGKSVSNMDSGYTRLKPLSEKYKKHRRNFSGLSSATKPSKSNLTYTGELLDSIKGKGTNDGAEVYITGERNKKIVGYQEDQGRPFFYLSKYEITQVKRMIRKKISQAIKRMFD